ncbi:MAG: ATP-binding protein, partial [Lachnospiraceae bacterium]|nr:ATP-binding protein [Lachnospiraceae bacterium]
MKPFNLSQAVQDTADAFEGIGDMNNTQICTKIAENLTVTADEASVVQLLTILTDNALKYALPDTNVELRLSRQGRHVCFETINAWDRSTPSDQLDRFFDRFYRGDPSRSGGAKARGYGLGLSIAQAIASRNHLTLHVLEDEAHRIVFRVLFP